MATDFNIHQAAKITQDAQLSCLASLIFSSVGTSEPGSREKNCNLFNIHVHITQLASAILLQQNPLLN